MINIKQERGITKCNLHSCVRVHNSHTHILFFIYIFVLFCIALFLLVMLLTCCVNICWVAFALRLFSVTQHYWGYVMYLPVVSLLRPQSTALTGFGDSGKSKAVEGTKLEVSY